MGDRIGHIDPAQAIRTPLDIQAHQLTDAQTTAVQEFGDASIARLQFGRIAELLVLCQTHRVVHTQGLGQGLTSFGGSNALNRVVVHVTLARHPVVKTAPTRDDQGNASRRTSRAVHLRHPTPNVRGLHRGQVQFGGVGQLAQTRQIQGVKGNGAIGQSLVVAHVRQIVTNPNGRAVAGLDHGHCWDGTFVNRPRCADVAMPHWPTGPSGSRTRCPYRPQNAARHLSP